MRYLSQSEKAHIREAWLHKKSWLKSRPSELLAETDFFNFESEFGALPGDLKWFFENCGSGGSEFEIESLSKLSYYQRKFQRHLQNDLTNVVILGVDGCGNPFGISRSSGKILLRDHETGEIEQIADSFPHFLKTLVDSPPLGD